jgi:hypothetical protein
MDSLFEALLQNKKYLAGVSKHTLRSYGFALDKLKGFELTG